MTMQGIPPQDGFNQMMNRNNNGGIWQSLGAGFHVLGVFLLAFLFWPLLLPMIIPAITSWGIIIVLVIWWFIMITGIAMWRRSR